MAGGLIDEPKAWKSKRDGQYLKTEAESRQLITLADTASSDFIYIGTAALGALKSQAVWRIQRVDLRTSLIEILFADSTEDFTNVWDNRVGLVYG
jgi:hypothetical protein